MTPASRQEYYTKLCETHIENIRLEISFIIFLIKFSIKKKIIIIIIKFKDKQNASLLILYIYRLLDFISPYMRVKFTLKPYYYFLMAYIRDICEQNKYKHIYKYEDDSY